MMNSKKILLGAVIAFIYAAPAMAVDWTGYYGGMNAGYGFGSAKATTTTMFSPTGYFAATSPGAIAAAGDQSVNASGIILGAEVGYNWRAGSNIAGVEADLDYFGMKGSTSNTGIYPCCVTTGFTVKSEVKTNWLLTVRPKYGWESGDSLYYLTGGLAFTNLTGTFTFTDTFATAHESASASQTKAGWVIGGGAEFAMQGPWSAKVEYLYANFGKVSTTSNNLTAFNPAIAYPTNTFSHAIDLKVSIIRAGVNYKF